MVNTRDSVGHVFVVDKVKIEAIPVRHNVINNLDQIGQLVDLPRLNGESIKNYKHRVLDVYPHRANATYRGLVNGITRELGLLQFDALTVDIKAGSDGLPESPRIIVDSTEVILYNKWESSSDYEIDKIINIYKRRGNDYNGFHIEDLISEINSSSYFTATIGVNVDPKTRSTNLIRSSSDKIIASEFIPANSSFRLDYGNIIQNTLFFEETNVFKNEKSTESAVTIAGDYYVNYETGRIVVKTIPSGDGRARYIVRNIPFVAQASPISLVDFKDPNYRKEVFKTIELENGIIVEGIPESEAVDIINELLSIKEQYWGI